MAAKVEFLVPSSRDVLPHPGRSGLPPQSVRPPVISDYERLCQLRQVQAGLISGDDRPLLAVALRRVRHEIDKIENIQSGRPGLPPHKRQF